MQFGQVSFVEIRRNGDVELNEEAGELWFTPHMSVRFLPGESIGDPRHVRVTVPSLALMLYDNNTMYRMKVGITDKDKWSIKVLSKYLKGKSLDQQTPLESYNFTNTYEGVSYPPGLTPSSPLNVYRIGVCRPLNLEYKGQKHLEYGPQAMVFKISDETFHRDCGVPQGMCGMLDLSKCTYGIPIAISRTHFLHSDPKLFDRKMGFELQTNLSLQLNMVMGDVSFNKEVSMFSNMTVPIAYIKVAQPEVFDNFKLVLKIVYVWGPNVLLCVEILMLIIGITLIAKALKLYWTNRHCDSEASLVTAIDEKQVPLMT
ncbi:Scavenger receptor class B type 1 like protein 12 [Operophtera brumata]|uniref:Scavenger receptor class B member 1 n=1 Tax=Operophtera brumata TaxID=104452 RepID=A0A0L7LHQ8_OPEBR|nr:Scavenger receptor class B type 1 like protein 12 [Operophtera brumata]